MNGPTVVNAYADDDNNVVIIAFRSEQGEWETREITRSQARQMADQLHLLTTTSRLLRAPLQN